jgi:hypothetical protein
MIRNALFAAASIALLVGTPSFAANSCRDAHGRFTKCPGTAAKPAPVVKKTVTAKLAPAAKPVHCKLNGKFAKCGTPGAKPA